MTKLAYCRDCKTVIAVGPLAASRTVQDKRGNVRRIATLPSHAVDGKRHANVGLLDLPGQAIPSDPKQLRTLFDVLTKKYKAEFK